MLHIERQRSTNGHSALVSFKALFRCFLCSPKCRRWTVRALVGSILVLLFLVLYPPEPGEMGKGVYINKERLPPEEREKYIRGWHDNALNSYVSDVISIHRSLPDVRDPGCKYLEYKTNLLRACVVVVFHNEAWSVLLRTIHSVLDRSNPDLIKQVILVDDFSDKKYLKKPLDEFVAMQPNVSLIRSRIRLGTGKARMMGFDRCSSQIAIFMDSHCEVTEGWLEPLLDPISRNVSVVTVPTIDVIDADTFAMSYLPVTDTQVGGFDWNLDFRWHFVSDVENKRRNYNFLMPARTPAMSGDIFAISSEFFRRLGMYDPGMDDWGGEDLELSVRTWMCGGTILTIPCSHVGHVFRKRVSSNEKARNTDIKKNRIRMAEVWMDEFKDYYYERLHYKLGDYGDVTQRKALRENLNCTSFNWYLNTVYPDQFLPSEALASGQIRNPATDLCADVGFDQKTKEKLLVGWPCHKYGGERNWLLTDLDQIVRDDWCWHYSGEDDVTAMACHRKHGHYSNQRFRYTEENTIYSLHHNKCLAVSQDKATITMETCTTGTERQLWFWYRSPPPGPKRG